MSKIKIEIELDINFQKFFDEIPEGLYKEKTNSDKAYEIEAVYEVLQNCYSSNVMECVDKMNDKYYDYHKHHYLINKEIARQLAKNVKIVNYIK